MLSVKALRDRYKSYEADFKRAKQPAKDALYKDHKARQKALIDEHKRNRAAVIKSGLSAQERKAEYSILALDSAKNVKPWVSNYRLSVRLFRSRRCSLFASGWLIVQAKVTRRLLVSFVVGITRRKDAVSLTKVLISHTLQPMALMTKKYLKSLLEFSITSLGRLIGNGRGCLFGQSKEAFIDEGKGLILLSLSKGIVMPLPQVYYWLGKSSVSRLSSMVMTTLNRLAVEIAAEKNIAVKFADPALEKRRQELIKQRQRHRYTERNRGNFKQATAGGSESRSG